MNCFRNTLPESVEEIDEQEVECEYEEHNIEKPSVPSSPGGSSPYKVGRAQFYSCQRRGSSPRSPSTSPRVKGQRREGGTQSNTQNTICLKITAAYRVLKNRCCTELGSSKTLDIKNLITLMFEFGFDNRFAC